MSKELQLHEQPRPTKLAKLDVLSRAERKRIDLGDLGLPMAGYRSHRQRLLAASRTISAAYMNVGVPNGGCRFAKLLERLAKSFS
jgi:hypothetical protein